MKKTFTFLFAVGMALSAAAQPAHESNNAFNKNKNEDMNARSANLPVVDRSNNFEFSSFSYKEKERQVREINLKYDREIASVKRNRRLGWKQKSVQIQILEDHRNNEIRQVQYAFEKNSHKVVDNGYGRNNNHKR